MSSHTSPRPTPGQPGMPPLTHQLPRASLSVSPPTGGKPNPAREPAPAGPAQIPPREPAQDPVQDRGDSHPGGPVEVQTQGEIRLEPHVRQQGQPPSPQQAGESPAGQLPASAPPRGPQTQQPTGNHPVAAPPAAADDTAGHPPLPVMPAGRPGDAGPLFRGALGSRTSPLRMRHLMALCAWAAAVTLLGLGVGLWVLVRLMSEATPFWFEPLIVLSGLVGVTLAIAAFVTIDRRYQPWLYMTGSTLMLGVTVGLTIAVT